VQVLEQPVLASHKRASGGDRAVKTAFGELDDRTLKAYQKVGPVAWKASAEADKATKAFENASEAYEEAAAKAERATLETEKLSVAAEKASKTYDKIAQAETLRSSTAEER
jgi:hypothetical protein